MSALAPSNPVPPLAPRDRILALARSHFFAHGFRSVTMDDLASELGISKKTLYTHFPSKAQLLEAVVQSKFNHVQSDLERLSATAWPDFSTALQRRLECLQRHLEEAQPPFLRDLRRDPETFGRIERFRHQQIQRHFGGLLKDARAKGLIRADVPPDLILAILLAAVQGIMNPRALEELGLTLRAAFTGILKTVLEGVLSESGRTPPHASETTITR